MPDKMFSNPQLHRSHTLSIIRAKKKKKKITISRDRSLNRDEVSIDNQPGIRITGEN